MKNITQAVKEKVKHLARVASEKAATVIRKTADVVKRFVARPCARVAAVVGGALASASAMAVETTLSIGGFDLGYETDTGQITGLSPDWIIQSMTSIWAILFGIGLLLIAFMFFKRSRKG